MFDTLKLLAENLVFERVTSMLDTKYVDDNFEISLSVFVIFVTNIV